MKEPFEYEDELVYEVPVTLWGDYCGSSVERSNYRSLLRDYPELFIEVYGDFYSKRLYIPADKMDDEMREMLVGLEEQYPLYDEEDHSSLEMDCAWEAWDLYLKDEFSSMETELHWEDWTDKDWEFVQQRYYDLTYDQSGCPYMESADSVVFPDHDKVTEELWTELETLGLEHDPRRPNPNQMTLPGTE